MQVSDVAPDGTATPLTSGLLEGNQRALDTSMTWYAPDGKPLLPYHPYTQPSQTPVVPGQVTRYDVEVFPTYDTLAPGHRLRITIATSDFPHALPAATQLPGPRRRRLPARAHRRLPVERRAAADLRPRRSRPSRSPRRRRSAVRPPSGRLNGTDARPGAARDDPHPGP